MMGLESIHSNLTLFMQEWEPFSEAENLGIQILASVAFQTKKGKIMEVVKQQTFLIEIPLPGTAEIFRCQGEDLHAMKAQLIDLQANVRDAITELSKALDEGMDK
jgi:hypothetical protein